MSSRALAAAAFSLLVAGCGGSPSDASPGRSDNASDVPMPPAATTIIAWGDSFTEGAGASSPDASYPADLAKITGRDVVNEGIGGETSQEIAARENAAPLDTRVWTNILWMGRNNSWELDQVLADVAACVRNLQTDHFVILSVLNGAGEGRGTSVYRDITALNDRLAQAYPGHEIDIRGILVERYRPLQLQDELDHTEDIVPTSLRSDGVHLNDTGYQIVAETVADFLEQHGW